MEVVSCWITRDSPEISLGAHRVLWTTSGVTTGVEGSYETLECNLGRPCLPESLIIALAHWCIKRKLVDHASWQYNARQTDLALRGNFEVTIAIAMTYIISTLYKYMYTFDQLIRTFESILFS